MNDNLLLPLLIAVSGLGLLAAGWFKRGRSQFFAKVPLRTSGELSGEEPQFLSGAAASPVKFSSPVAKTECVFYRERTERLERSHSSRGGHNTRWVSEGAQVYGAFFLKDDDGAVFVLPGRSGLELSAPEISDETSLPGMGAAGDVRRFEQAVKEGETVTILGIPRPLAGLMAYLRASGDAFLPAGLVQRLADMEKDPSYSRTPCFYGDGLTVVTDRPHAEFVAGADTAWKNYMGLGALLLAGGLAALFYMLKGSGPSGDPY